MANTEWFEKLKNHYLQDGQIITWLKFNENELANLSVDEAKLSRNHIYASKNFIFKEPKLQKYFSQFEWYKPSEGNIEPFINPTDTENLDLLLSFENANIMNPYPFSGLDFRTILIGCWQLDSSTINSNYNDRFLFDRDDYSFAFIRDVSKKVLDKDNLNFSGRFRISDNHKIEFEIITKDIVKKILLPPSINSVTKKQYGRAKYEIETIHINKEEGYEYKTLLLGGMHHINLGGIKKVFIKIDNKVYWKIKKTANECE